MKEIVKVLLQEGIDEETIHEVLNVIEENYEIVDEEIHSAIDKYAVKNKAGRDALHAKADKNQDLELHLQSGRITRKNIEHADKGDRQYMQDEDLPYRRHSGEDTKNAWGQQFTDHRRCAYDKRTRGEFTRVKDPVVKSINRHNKKHAPKYSYEPDWA